jgi:catechol 2,3-dioxygenase-like lactoylglutathione lyase family enzyme
MGDNGVLYGTSGPEFVVLKPRDGKPATHANGGTIGFAAPSRAAVHAFHAAGLAHGGTDDGAPGPRAFTPTAYAAYQRDPAGNKICAYCFLPE